MSTEHAIDEALKLRTKFANGPVIYGGELAELIAHVREKSRNDALEVLARHFEKLGAGREMFCGSIADEIRDLKNSPDSAAPAKPASEDAWLEDAIEYVKPFGGNCRDCADNDGICPTTHLPCVEKDAAIRSVLSAVVYGEKNGYLRTRPTKEGFILVSVATLTVSAFRGHLENVEFQYHGNLPDGTYPLYCQMKSMKESGK